MDHTNSFIIFIIIIQKVLIFHYYNRSYAEQTEMLNRMRGMLEDENNQKRAQMMK